MVENAGTHPPELGESEETLKRFLAQVRQTIEEGVRLQMEGLKSARDLTRYGMNLRPNTPHTIADKK